MKAIDAEASIRNGLQLAIDTLLDIRAAAARCDDVHCRHDDCEVNGADLVDALGERLKTLEFILARNNG